jgi:DMSO/TMAO reductase YedYZ molybdopterin-dependent catalytic subunit
MIVLMLRLANRHPRPSASARRRLTCVASSVVVSLVVTVTAQSPTVRQAPSAHAPTTSLAIAGDVPHPLTLDLAALRAMSRHMVTVREHDVTHTYDGVLVGDLLARAGAPLGDRFRGPAVSTYVLATASDGYEVVYSLAELDPAFTHSEVIVADTVDGGPLDATTGPLRVVVPGDVRPARSIRMLQRLEVVQIKK